MSPRSRMQLPWDAEAHLVVDHDVRLEQDEIRPNDRSRHSDDQKWKSPCSSDLDTLGVLRGDLSAPKLINEGTGGLRHRHLVGVVVDG